MAADVGLVVRSLVGLATGALYFIVGRLILRREVAASERAANRLFATWWIALAILYGAVASSNLASAFGVRDLIVAVALLEALLVLICVALWGLMGFLLYVYTGTNRWLTALAVFYGLLAVGFLWLIEWMSPTGFKEPTGTDLAFENQLGDSGSIVVGLLFSVPIFAGALAYASLAFRVRGPAPRYRIGMVAGAFLVQFGWSIVSATLGLARKYPDSVALLVVQQAIAIAVPIFVILAYRPPAWIRHRLEAASAGA